MSERFDLSRLMAMLVKEFIQMRRDRLTFGMMIGVPILQLMLFGYAINADPKHLPTAVVMPAPSPYARAILGAIDQTGYFALRPASPDAETAERLLAEGAVQFILTFPQDLTRSIERGETAVILVESDATDPTAIGNALAALGPLATRALDHDLPALREAAARPSAETPGAPPIELRAHRRYNPEGLSSRNIVPGLIGIVLTMTMVMMTALAVTRERERGTMETLLAMPLRPVEVMIGKIAPYVMVGFIQVVLILLMAGILFAVPLQGDAGVLLVGLIVFITANLAIGFTISTVAENQLQALQMSMFFFLPSILLSGFMFPFRGMPQWAQVLGEALPATHFMRLIRGVLLKGNGWAETWPEIWPLLIILAVVTMLALRRYRLTLD